MFKHFLYFCLSFAALAHTFFMSSAFLSSWASPGYPHTLSPDESTLLDHSDHMTSPVLLCLALLLPPCHGCPLFFGCSPSLSDLCAWCSLIYPPFSSGRSVPWRVFSSLVHMFVNRMLTQVVCTYSSTLLHTDSFSSRISFKLQIFFPGFLNRCSITSCFHFQIIAFGLNGCILQYT